MPQFTFSRLAVRLAAAALLMALAAAFGACEKPDASNTTSPSAKALLGTTSGTVTYAPAETAPAPVAPPDGWEFELGNVRFTKLENETPSIIVISTLKARPAAAMEMWLVSGATPVVRWVGGESRTYDGTLCFNLRLQDMAEAVPLGPGPHTFIVAFRDHAGTVITARKVNVTSFPPQLTGTLPVPGSPVFRVLLSCPRGS